MGMKKLSLILLVAALVLAAIAVSAETAPVETGAPATEASQISDEAAPEASAAPMDTIIGAFSTVDLDGNAVDSNIFTKSKLTLVNVWATYCGPCLKEIPHLAKLDEEIDDFQILGILGDAGSKGALYDKNVELGKEILESSGASYVNVVPDDVLITKMMNYITAYPTSFFMDQNGKIVGKAIVGSMGYDDWKNVIMQKMAEVEAA
jgi:thiol-disulfide isomerase/thioredoxin